MPGSEGAGGLELVPESDAKNPPKKQKKMGPSWGYIPGLIFLRQEQGADLGVLGERTTDHRFQLDRCQSLRMGLDARICHGMVWGQGSSGKDEEIVPFSTSQDQCAMRYRLGLTQSPGWDDDCPRGDGQPEQRVRLVWSGSIWAKCPSEQLVPESQCEGRLTVFSV